MLIHAKQVTGRLSARSAAFEENLKLKDKDYNNLKKEQRLIASLLIYTPMW